MSVTQQEIDKSGWKQALSICTELDYQPIGICDFEPLDGPKAINKAWDSSFGTMLELLSRMIRKYNI